MKKTAKKTARIFRQGDVLIIAVAAGLLGARPKQRERGGVVLAYGEVTGHSHRIEEPSAALMVLDDQSAMAEAARQLLASVGLTMEIRDEDVVGVLDTPKGGHIEHEEHGTIPLREKYHVVLRQREYSPADIRQVAD
jgi:hypothetical protein